MNAVAEKAPVALRAKESAPAPELRWVVLWAGAAVLCFHLSYSSAATAGLILLYLAGCSVQSRRRAQA